ncbi:MAG: alpha-L-rhamnosidase-related protein [Phocaeicola sp.]|uniref:alpha-L-rhamnosidase-related protein n=1 Tax=Phocaeicola sp. TaxID=2773926 RepID=UPI003FA0DFC3
MKKILLFALGALFILPAFAQINFPPVFKNDTANIRMDKLTRLYIAPRRVVWVNNHDAVKGEHTLTMLSDGQNQLGNKNMCRMQTTSADTASIILDYGRELHGGIKMMFGTSDHKYPAQIRLRFGESVEETCCELYKGDDYNPIGEGTNDHAIRDAILSIPQMGMIEFGNTGFRFVRIDLISPNRQIEIKEASAIFRFRNIPWVGSFKCSDDRLTKIWETGAYTIHLNMQENIWDGIKRDRLIWLGDMHPETSSIATVFGNDDSFYSSLDLACKYFPLPSWLNDMSAYSLWYLIIQHDWYMQNKNTAFLQKHKPYIIGLIDQINDKVDEEGNETIGDHFLDWPSNNNPEGVTAGYRALMIWAMKDAEILCNILNDNAHATKCKAIVQRLKKQTPDPNGLKQAAALMAIAGTMSPKEACDKYISVDGPKNFSTFYGYYMLEALALDGKYQEAMDIISRFWGGMLDLGATSFWEDFNLDWTKDAAGIDEFVPVGKKDIHGDFGAYCYPGYRHSLCHGWASGPTAWMSHHILGVEITKAGCEELTITPHLGKLQWAEGTYPTPQGPVYIKHQKEANGKVSTTVKGPEGVKIIVKETNSFR